MFRQLSNAQLGYVSAGALILVQCFIAISFKASQTAGNKYTFSQASSLALTEIIKFLLSAVLFSQGASSAEILEAKSEDEQEMLWGGEDLGQTPSYPRLPEGRVQRLYVRWKNELSREAVLGFGALAVLYATNNHAAFFVYRLADPGTIQLVKASSTIISATTMLLFLSRSIRELQWHALLIQALGLAVTQLGNVNINYSPSVYVILLGMTCISSIAGVTNDHLCKTTKASLHAQNMVLYAFGIAINVGVFIFIKLNDPEGVPSFFSGYGSVGAVALVFLNASLGLIITAVYKYADAIIKGIATTLTTAILIILSVIFFHAPLTWVAGVGCMIVFLTAFTFVKAGLKPPSTGRSSTPPPKRVLLGSALLFTLFSGIIITCNVYGWPA